MLKYRFDLHKHISVLIYIYIFYINLFIILIKLNNINKVIYIYEIL